MGKLVRATKAKGYSSISEMFDVKCDEILELINVSYDDTATTSKKGMLLLFSPFPSYPVINR